MPAFLIPILTALVPALVGEAEKLFSSPSSGSSKHDWVKGLVEDVVAGLEKRSPAWAQPEEGAIATLLENLIEAELDKIDP